MNNLPDSRTAVNHRRQASGGVAVAGERLLVVLALLLQRLRPCPQLVLVDAQRPRRFGDRQPLLGDQLHGFDLELFCGLRRYVASSLPAPFLRAPGLSRTPHKLDGYSVCKNSITPTSLCRGLLASAPSPSQLASAFGTVQTSLSWFVSSFSSLASWKASIDRLLTFEAAVAATHRSGA